MKVTEIELTNSEKSCELAAWIGLDRSPRTFRLYFRFPSNLSGELKLSADPFIAAFLLASMRSNETLTVEAPVSQRLLEALPKIIEFYSSWNRKYHRIDVRVSNLPDSVPSFRSNPSKANGLFFSCGVDSFYSLTELSGGPKMESPTHLILVHGFDIALDNQPFFDIVRAATDEVARHYGIERIVMSTNLKQFTDQFVEWEHAYGGALASTALCLGGFFSKVYIASDLGPAYITPMGAHPDLDPLWSTETTNFVHYGHLVSRTQRTQAIASNPLAQKHLRVCWENRNGAYNCGSCAKCVRTMLDLHLAGALPNFKTFPTNLTPTLVRDMNLYPTEYAIRRSEYMLRELRKNGENDLAAALADAIRIARLRLAFAPVLPILDTIKNRLIRHTKITRVAPRVELNGSNVPD